jgi:hypothetical protein
MCYIERTGGKMVVLCVCQDIVTALLKTAENHRKPWSG